MEFGVRNYTHGGLAHKVKIHFVPLGFEVLWAHVPSGFWGLMDLMHSMRRPWKSKSFVESRDIRVERTLDIYIYTYIEASQNSHSVIAPYLMLNPRPRIGGGHHSPGPLEPMLDRLSCGLGFRV